MALVHELFDTPSYITVSLVSVLGSSVGRVSFYSSGPKIDPRVQNIFGANVSLSADSRYHGLIFELRKYSFRLVHPTVLPYTLNDNGKRYKFHK